MAYLTKWHLLASVAGGAVLGAATVAFVFYPPASGWGDGLDWGDVATWASAAVTAAAVVVAALAIWGDNRRQHAAQSAEWNRADAARRRRTAILAKVFHNELHRGHLEIRAVRICLERLTAENMAEFRATFPSGADRGIFAMMNRFAADLDGFEEMDAISILHASNLLSVTPIIAEGVDPRISDQYYLAKRDAFEADLAEVTSVFRELQERLETYFSHLPGIRKLTMDELRAAREERTERVAEIRRAGQSRRSAEK